MHIVCMLERENTTLLYTRYRNVFILHKYIHQYNTGIYSIRAVIWKYDSFLSEYSHQPYKNT